MNITFMRKNISLFIIATLTLLLVIIPVNHIQAAAVVDGINTGLDVAGQTTIAGDILDVGWVYTASVTYTLGRIEGKFAEADGSGSTIEFYTAPPSLGGTLLATGTFTPTAAAPAGTNWEGANLSNTVSIVNGNSYFVAFKNIYSSPTSNAAGAAPQLYYSLGSDDYSIVGTAGDNDAKKPIVRFFSADPPVITSAAPANGTQGTAYSHTYTATGNATITYTLATGTLPTGLTLSAAGVLSGTPTTPGPYSGTVTASNGATPDDTQAFSITIASSGGTAPLITSAAPANGTIGVAYTHTFTASGTPAPTFTVTGTLPTGITFDGVATISGTPTATGTFNGLSVVAANGNLPNATQNFSITINGTAPLITSAAPANGTIGVAYTHTFTASGSPAPTFTVTGTLPTGITFDGVATISGTPTATGTFNGLSVVAANGNLPNATQNFSITINGTAPLITSAAPASGTIGVAYTHTFTASGSPAPTFTVTGTLPTGITFDGVATISGTPTATGTFNGLSVVAANGNLPNATQNFSITINGTTPLITSAAPANGTIGVAYTHTFTATGNPAPTFTVTGTLPTGITFDGVATISGTPTATGTFNGLSVVAANGNLPNATQNFSITINGTTPLITSAAPANGIIGVAYSHTFTATGNPAPTFTVTGTLPTGITFDGVATISGTPTATGTFNGLSVVAANGNLPNATQNFSITINGTAPLITSAAPANGTIGVAYSHTFTATGNPAPTFTVTGTLPTGITFDGVATISGTPTATGTFNGLSVVAANGNLPNATQNFSITINGTAPLITSAAPANGTQGVAYTHTFTASGSPAPTFTVTGTLPTGITFDGVATISGIPTASGTFNGLSVVTANGNLPNATQNFSITINAVGGITLSPTTLPNSTVGTAYTQNITATGGTGPYTFAVTAGAQPTGLTLSAAGVLSGTPTVAATFNFTVTATDSLAATGSQAYTVIISAAGTPPVAPQPVVTHLAEPPPAPACTDTNFEATGMIRTHFTNDADRAGLSCRLMAANGSYLTWLGGPLTDSAMIGNKTVLDLGVVAAADVFSASSKNGFVGDVNICLKGSGYMIYMNANSSPRVPQLWSAWTTPAFPGYTCTTLYAPGTVILVSNKPS